jgi:hypothetical protein
MSVIRLGAAQCAILILTAQPAGAHGGDHGAFAFAEALGHAALSSGHMLAPAFVWVLAAVWCLLAVRRMRARKGLRNTRR